MVTGKVLQHHNKDIFKKIWDKRQIYLMLLPNLILFFSLAVYPITWLLKYMFFRYDKIYEPVFIGFENFIRIFTRDPYFWKSVINTFIYVGGKLLLTLPLALLVAVLLNRKFRGNRIIQIIVFSPTIISAAIMSMIFYLLLNPYSGEVNKILMAIGIIDQPVSWLSASHAMFSIIVIGVWGAIGNYMVYFISGLQSIADEIYESAELDGINAVQKFFFITIPMLAPILKIIIMLSITSSFQDMQSIMVLTEGGPNGATEVMFLYAYKLFFAISADTSIPSQFGYGAAVSFICACIIGIVTILYLKLTKRLDDIY